MPARNPRLDVSQKERTSAHGPADAVRNSGQSEDQNRQHVTPNVDTEVVAQAAQRPAQLPDRRDQALPVGPCSNQVRSATVTAFTLGSASKTS